MRILITKYHKAGDVIGWENGVDKLTNGEDVYIDVEEQPTTIPGLKFKPQMIGYDNDNEDYFWKFCTAEVSQQSYDLVKEITKGYMTHGILEIGVSRNSDGSFCHAMLVNKPDHIPYLGVDLDDKSYLNNPSKKIYTISENSYNQETVRNYMKEIGMNKISILFIDGHHSVNTVINDWLYSDLLSDNGIVIFHDTNFHTGPTIFIEAIDRNQYDVVKYFEEYNDYGVSIAYKK